MVMILAMRAFFLLSLFAFLGNQARTLPELHDKFNISNTNYGRTSSPPPPAPYTAPPHIQITSTSGIAYDKVTKMGRFNGEKPKRSPPPPPYIVPPHIQITSTSCVTESSCNKAPAASSSGLGAI